MNDGSSTKKGTRKIVDIELQYEQENDKTLLQLAVDEGKAEALQVKILDWSETDYCIANKMNTCLVLMEELH